MTDEMKNLILQYVDSVRNIWNTSKASYFIWLICQRGLYKRLGCGYYASG